MPTTSPHIRTRFGRAVVPGLILAATAVPAGAQEGCEFGEGTVRFQQEPIPGGGTMSYVAKPHFLCDDGVEIWADSAVANSLLGMSHLMGSVRYLDRTTELTADTARYFTDQGRLQANGNVTIRDDAEGSRIENGDLVLLRQTDFRDVQTISVTTATDGIRPRAIMTPAGPDSVDLSASPPAPYTVIGDLIYIEGDGYFTSVGNVEIERDSTFAYADSVEYREATDDLFLEGNARVVTGANVLVGRTITMGTPEADASEIWSRGGAVLTGDDLVLTSPQILVFLTGGALERLVAVPMRRGGDVQPDSADLVRPVATVEDFELTADSLEVTAPADVVERVVAVGRARSVSTSRDSLNVEALPEVARSDWLEGDTVVVTFKPIEPVPGADVDEKARSYEVETIVARVNARTLYRLIPSDSTSRPGTDPPAVHYVVGDTITITMVDGEVDAMDVVGQTRGVHLEPLPRNTRPDSVPDSTRVGVDTTNVGVERVPLRPTPIGSSGARIAPSHHSTPRKEEPWRRK